MQAEEQRGFLVTFEGLDGSGKTTQIRRLAAWLDGRGVPHIVTRQPGGTATGDRIRELLLDSKSNSLSPHAELAMMFADRAQAINEVIEPALVRGQIVVCDRFTDSTEAYQGGGRRLGSALVLELHRLICGGLTPDLTILLLPSVNAALARARRRNDKVIPTTGTDENRFEREQDGFFERVHDTYREIAEREPGRVVVVDGDQTIEQVHAQVIETIALRLAKRCDRTLTKGPRRVKML